MAINKRLLVKPPSTGITPSEHFGVVLYEGDGSTSHSINGGKFGAGVYGNQSTSRVTTNYTQANGVELTWSFWVFSGATAGIDTIIGAGTQFIMALEANKLYPMINGSNRGAGTSITADTWHHFAITYNGSGTTQVYKDGSLDVTVTGQTPTSMGTIKLFDSDEVGWGVLEGKIDQVRIFQKVLSSSEVSTLYAETTSTVESLDPLSEDTTDTLQVLGDSSCIATYRFENDEVDLSGNYNGTGSQIQYGAGRYGQAASFNNTSGSKMVIGAMNSVIPNNTTGVSFSFWVYLDSVNTGSNYDHWFVGQEDYGGAFSDGEFSVRLYEGKVYTDYAQSGSIYRQRKATTVLSTGQWYHIVATYDTSNANITEVYLNGSLETSSNLTSGGTFTTTALMQNSSNMSVGGGPTGTDGKIDQFRIFTKVLSASEVTTLYNENSLVASYRFEGNANDDTRNYDGTASNVTYEYGLNFTPDFIWYKTRTQAYDNNITDSTRGTGKQVRPNRTIAEVSATDHILSFDTGGFTVGSGGDANKSGDDYVAWCFKANGGTTSSNTDGTVTTTVQANQDAGFSIVTWTGGSSGTATTGHGLSAPPDLIIQRPINATSDWFIWHKDLTSGNSLRFTTAAQSTAIAFTVNSSIFYTNWTNTSYNWLAYCFHSVEGFSKFGSYVGNGSTDGPIVETGFEPAFIMFKRTDSTSGWNITDNRRNTTNPRTSVMQAHNSDIEYTSNSYAIDFLSNGFQIVNSDNGWNTNGGTYIYMAFAADPDTEAPAVAKSFNIAEYDGGALGSSYPVTGLGFQPNLVWIKCIDTGHHHYIVDSIRGADKVISTSSTNADPAFTPDEFGSFDSDGFTLTPTSGGGRTAYSADGPYVAWTWKADDNEPTIFEPSQTVADIKSTNITLNLNLAGGSYSGSGSAIEDLSSAEEDFTVTNATIPSGFGGYYIDFDGSGDYADSDSSIATTSGNDITIEFWIRPESATQTSYAMIIDANHSTAVSGSTGSGWCIQQTASTSNSYYFVYYDGSTYQSNSDAQLFTLTNGVWSHIAIVKSGTSVQVYKDGSAGTSWTASNGNLANPNQKIRLGGWLAGGRDFNGNIAQVRLYSDALSSSQVTANYNATKGLFTTIQSIVSANANAGFSIVKYEGNGTSGTKVSHGLSAAPEMIIVKNLTSSSAWPVFHTSIGATKYLALNETTAQDTATNVWNDTAPNSTTFTVGNWGPVNTSGNEHIAYCFHSVSNFSKIGTFTGTGTGTNQLINTGFQPDWVMFKDYSAGGSWIIVDSVRGGSKSVKANASDAESTTNYVTFESNGFRVAGDANATSSWVYAAFKIN